MKRGEKITSSIEDKGALRKYIMRTKQTLHYEYLHGRVIDKLLL